MLRILIIGCLILLSPLTSTAEEIDLSLGGFLQGNYSMSLAGSNPDGGDLKWAEERVQLKIEVLSADLRFFSKTDLYYDHICREAEVEFREAYIDYSSMLWDLRAGRQIITWGIGDLVFINDVFPKDYEAFFSGRPMEYMKRPVDALKIGVYPESFSLDIVIIPFFEPNRLPEARRFHLYNPLSGTGIKEEEPPATLENTELALRFYRDLTGVEIALYLYRGFYRTPSVKTEGTSLLLFYPELNVYGASMQLNGLGGLIGIEAGYYDSRQDRAGTNPFIPNSTLRFLLTYQRQFWRDFTVTIQYSGQYMDDYSEYLRTLPQGMPEARRYSDLLAVRLTQLLMYQNLKLGWFSLWSLTDGDYLLNPEIRYRFSDRIWASIGAMVFGGGEEWGQFGGLDRNDNLYLQIRYEF